MNLVLIEIQEYSVIKMAQERLQEERLDIIQELADLECDQGKKIDKLRRKVRQTIGEYNFNELENI